MQTKGFFPSLFDYSFVSFVTPRIIKVLYVLATIVISLSTLLFVLAAFNVSSGAGIAMLVIGGPLFFLISMIYARVFLELVIVFFRINGNVQEIRDRRGGDATQPTPIPATSLDALAAAHAEAPARVADTTEAVSSDESSEQLGAAAALDPATPAADLPPEGWYDDPERPGHKRWWDGTAWALRDDEQSSAH